MRELWRTSCGFIVAKLQVSIGWSSLTVAYCNDYRLQAPGRIAFPDEGPSNVKDGHGGIRKLFKGAFIEQTGAGKCNGKWR